MEERMDRQHQEQRTHAIVMGGSMAGLVTARVLSAHFERVTLVERDPLPPGADHRRGVPQGRHTHGLLASGRRVLDRLFPGISEELMEGGAVPDDLLRDSRWFVEGGRLARASSGLDGLLMSRPYLESVVRRRVLALPNLSVRQNAQVEGLLFGAAGTRVTGVRLRSETLAADLVVDTTGRGSRSPQWLEEMGYERPVEEHVEIALRYTTRLFRRRATDLNGDSAVVVPPTPEGKRGGVMLAQEGDRWTVTLITHFGDEPPAALAGFLEFARDLPSSDIYEVVRDAEPIGDATSTRFLASTRRRYEKLRRFPRGYLVLGDGISSFNPIYGQGMSVAALEAVELDATLRKGSTDLARRFFARAAKVVDTPWAVAVGNDLRMPETIAPRSAAVNLVNWYLAHLRRAAHHDPTLAVAFMKVANLVATPASVLHPRLVLRVFLGNLARGSRAAHGGASVPTAPTAETI
jgi:2-polyprenyl-6-methoxyphenol hydroxylase-like FAD-dependent oxidoreductase